MRWKWLQQEQVVLMLNVSAFSSVQVQGNVMYYWYAIIFLVFDIAFMFLAFGGIISIQDTEMTPYSQIMGALTTMSIFIALMSLGVWHVFRKRGRIYI